MRDRWLIGVEVGPDTSGPLVLAAWLHDVLDAPLQAVHVVTVPPLPQRFHDELEAGVRKLIDQQLTEVGLRSAISLPEVRFGADVADELALRARALEANLIIGRAAPREGRRMVRLGRVARRVLRRLPGPVAVVPPDFALRDLGAGPVLLALDAFCDGAAVELARALSHAARRDLVVVHVFDNHAESALLRVRPEVAQTYRAAWQAAAQQRLAEQVERHGLASVPLRTAEGSTIDRLLDAAVNERASLVVCGSRQLSRGARVFSGSVGSSLAGRLPTPVFVVPPGDAREKGGG